MMVTTTYRTLVAGSHATFDQKEPVPIQEVGR